MPYNCLIAFEKSDELLAILTPLIEFLARFFFRKTNCLAL